MNPKAKTPTENIEQKNKTSSKSPRHHREFWNVPHSPDIRSAPRRQSHLSERPAERLEAKSPATCQILWLTFLPGTHLAALSTGGRGETGGSQTELLEGILTVSFIAANNETGERRSWTCEFPPLFFLPFQSLLPFNKERKRLCVCVFVWDREIITIESV